MQSGWNVDFTRYDRAHKVVGFAGTAQQFFNSHLTHTARDIRRQSGDVAFASELCNSAIDYLYLSMGRPRWFVDQKMLELLLECKIDLEFDNIFFPHDVQTLVFERGCKIGNYDLRWIRFARIRSPLAQRMLTDLFGCELASLFESFRTGVYGEADLSLKLKSYEPVPDLGIEDTATFSFAIPDRPQGNVNYLSGEPQFLGEVLEKVKKVVGTALLYFAARPELCIDFELPRAQRYRQFGERTHLRRLLLPALKIVSTSATNQGSGLRVKPHYRGWVLRTLRHERFQRNPDGTFKTILVPPCAIHPDEIQSAP